MSFIHDCDLTDEQLLHDQLKKQKYFIIPITIQRKIEKLLIKNQNDYTENKEKIEVNRYHIKKLFEIF